MRSMRAAICCLFAALALSGCMGLIAPVAVAFAEPAPVRLDAAYHLDNPEVIAAYLGEAFETGDSTFIANAIRTLARARSMDDMAEKLGLSHSGLYKAP